MVIGATDDLPTRFAALEAYYRRPLVVLAVLPGGPTEEAALHARFGHLRCNEARGRRQPLQYLPGADLLRFLGEAPQVATGPRAVAAMPPAGGRGVPITLELSPEAHRMLRVVASEQGVPVVVYAQELFEQTVRSVYAEWGGS